MKCLLPVCSLNCFVRRIDISSVSLLMLRTIQWEFYSFHAHSKRTKNEKYLIPSRGSYDTGEVFIPIYFDFFFFLKMAFYEVQKQHSNLNKSKKCLDYSAEDMFKLNWQCPSMKWSKIKWNCIFKTAFPTPEPFREPLVCAYYTWVICLLLLLLFSCDVTDRRTVKRTKIWNVSSEKYRPIKFTWSDFAFRLGKFLPLAYTLASSQWGGYVTRSELERKMRKRRKTQWAVLIEHHFSDI